MNKIIRYFDINSNIRPKMAVAKAGIGRLLSWLPQWLALVTGIWLSPYFEAYRVNGHWAFVGGWGRLLFAGITALIVFPAVYKKVVAADALPIFLYISCFVSGLGYETLLHTGLHAAATVTTTAPVTTP